MAAFVLWFGRHRGEDISAIPLSYLTWLHAQDWPKPNLKRAVARELHRRQIDEMERQSKAWADAWDDDLPRAEPQTVEGVYLDEIASGRFQQAVERGELVITRDLPISSPLPEAWRRWCAANGREH